MIIVFAIIFSIISIIISYCLRKDHEPGVLLKLIGFYFLSIVTITLNSSIPIPVGFLASLILVEASRLNKRAKKVCITLGLADFIICAILFYT